MLITAPTSGWLGPRVRVIRSRTRSKWAVAAVRSPLLNARVPRPLSGGASIGWSVPKARSRILDRAGEAAASRDFVALHAVGLAEVVDRARVLRVVAAEGGLAEGERQLVRGLGLGVAAAAVVVAEVALVDGELRVLWAGLERDRAIERVQGLVVATEAGVHHAEVGAQRGLKVRGVAEAVQQGLGLAAPLHRVVVATEGLADQVQQAQRGLGPDPVLAEGFGEPVGLLKGLFGGDVVSDALLHASAVEQGLGAHGLVAAEIRRR